MPKVKTKREPISWYLSKRRKAIGDRMSEATIINFSPYIEYVYSKPVRIPYQQVDKKYSHLRDLYVRRYTDMVYVLRYFKYCLKNNIQLTEEEVLNNSLYTGMYRETKAYEEIVNYTLKDSSYKTMFCKDVNSIISSFLTPFEQKKVFDIEPSFEPKNTTEVTRLVDCVQAGLLYVPNKKIYQDYGDHKNFIIQIGLNL